MPLRTADGFVLGALCCIDPVAREFTSQHIEMLEILANQVIALLELRRQQLQATTSAAEHAREKAEFLAILDRVPALVSYWDRGMVNIYSNASYLEHFGISPQDLRGQNIRDFLSQTRLTDNLPRVYAVLDGTTQSFDIELTDAVGSKREVHVALVPNVQDAEVTGFIMLATDVTARNESARALLHSRSTSQALLDALPSSVIQLSHDGYVSAIYGRTVDHLVLQTDLSRPCHWRALFKDSVLAQIAAHFDRSIARATEHQGVESLEFAVTDDDAVFHYEARFIRVPYSSDLVCLVLDITAKRQQEQSLRDYSERLAAVIKAAPDGILLLDENGWIEQVSPMIEKLSGYRECELFDKHIKTLVPTAIWETVAIASPAAASDLNVTLWRETALMRKDGTELSAEISLSGFEFSGRRLFTAIVRDTSKREIMRARSQFIALVSHELRAPLTAMIGLGEAMLDEPSEPLSVMQRESLTIMQQSAQHLSALVTDILDLSRIELGMLRLDRRKYPIAMICDVTTAMVADVGQRKQVIVHKHYEHGDEPVLADRRRLTQILMNLLDNAIKFTPEYGNVTLHTRCHGSQVEFTISDTGIGITAADCKKLFSPFSQIESTTNRKYQGTGLGLYLARRLTLLHGGDISVQSTPGQGSVFTVSIPRCIPNSGPIDE